MIKPVDLTLLLSACLLLAGCATSLPKFQERPVSTAFADPETTELGLFFASEMDAHPAKSGIVPVTPGEWGFRSRTGLANQAEQTIDVQYYIWETDTAGSILAERILRAADRGVRVWVARGSIAYSAVSQPPPDASRQAGTFSSTDTLHRTRVPPVSTSTEPSG